MEIENEGNTLLISARWEDCRDRSLTWETVIEMLVTNDSETHIGNQTISVNKKTQRNKFTLENMDLSSELSTTSFYVVISQPHYDTVSPVFQMALKDNGL